MTGPDPWDDVVQALLEGRAIQGGPEGARILDPSPAPDPGDSTPRSFAFDESGEPWLIVEHPDDPAFEDDLVVSFDSFFIFDCDAKIDRATAFLGTLPGVQSAEREDSHDIFIVGTRDAQRIRDSLVAWWAAEPRA